MEARREKETLHCRYRPSAPRRSCFVLHGRLPVARDRTFVPYTGGPDLYSATGEDLAQLDKCGYSAAFGPVTSGKAAADAAAQAISEVYGKSERPYIVRFNETADAWIVRGSMGFLSLGGVAIAAIDRSTGEVITLFPTK